MKEITVDSIKRLEDVILQFVKSELESVPEAYHDLIPGQLLPEEQLAWVIKAKRAGLLPSGVNPYYMSNHEDGKNEDTLSLLADSNHSREEKLKKMVDYFIKNEFRNIPKNIRELIPPNLSVEEKLAWVRKARDKGTFQMGMPKSPKMALNKGLGTGPYTGPGTAPGTGPGTAPWLENENVNLYKNMPSNSKAQKSSIIKVKELEDKEVEETNKQLSSELSEVNQILVKQTKNTKKQR